MPECVVLFPMDHSWPGSFSVSYQPNIFFFLMHLFPLCPHTLPTTLHYPHNSHTIMAWRARLGHNMHELCVVLCNTGERSNGVRYATRQDATFHVNFSRQTCWYNLLIYFYTLFFFLICPPSTSFNFLRCFRREFVRSQYKHVKALNPSTPILIREHPGEEARIIATYGYGVERKVVVDGMDQSQIEREVQNLVAAGEMMKKK